VVREKKVNVSKPKQSSQVTFLIVMFSNTKPPSQHSRFYHTHSTLAASFHSVIILEAVGGQGDVAARVGAALALVLLVPEVLPAHRAEDLVGLGPVAVLADVVIVYAGVT
jgi:hypothetical protein